MFKLIISDLSTGLMNNGKYKEALQKFQRIITNETPVNKILISSIPFNV